MTKKPTRGKPGHGYILPPGAVDETEEAIKSGTTFGIVGIAPEPEPNRKETNLGISKVDRARS